MLAILLAASALASPLPSPPTCTAASTKISSLTLHDFDFHASYVFSTPAHQNSWGHVDFTLANAALPYVISCSADSNQLDDFFYGTETYACAPRNGTAASFTYSRPDGVLRVNQTWSCAEGTRFSAQGMVKLAFACVDETWQNPDWQQGELYNIRTITCDNVTTEVPLDVITVVG